jgi:hypothetical protein
MNIVLFIRLLMGVIGIAFIIGGFAFLYVGRVDIAIYLTMWSMWIDLLARMNR